MSAPAIIPPLLARAEPQTGVELLEAFYGHLQVAGTPTSKPSIGEAAPSELYVLRPDRMSVVPGADGWPVGWEHRAGSNVRRFERDPISNDAPILHFKLFNPNRRLVRPLADGAAAFSIDIPNAGAPGTRR